MAAFNRDYGADLGRLGLLTDYTVWGPKAKKIQQEDALVQDDGIQRDRNRDMQQARHNNGVNVPSNMAMAAKFQEVVTTTRNAAKAGRTNEVIKGWDLTRSAFIQAFNCTEGLNDSAILTERNRYRALRTDFKQAEEQHKVVTQNLQEQIQEHEDALVAILEDKEAALEQVVEQMEEKLLAEKLNWQDCQKTTVLKERNCLENKHTEAIVSLRKRMQKDANLEKDELDNVKSSLVQITEQYDEVMKQLEIRNQQRLGPEDKHKTSTQAFETKRKALQTVCNSLASRSEQLEVCVHQQKEEVEELKKRESKQAERLASVDELRQKLGQDLSAAELRHSTLENSSTQALNGLKDDQLKGQLDIALKTKEDLFGEAMHLSVSLVELQEQLRAISIKARTKQQKLREYKDKVIEGLISERNAALRKAEEAQIELAVSETARSFDNQIRDLITANDGKVYEAKTAHLNEIIELQTAQEKEIGELMIANEKKLSKLKTANHDEIRAMRAAQEKEISDLKISNEKKLSQCQWDVDMKESVHNASLRSPQTGRNKENNELATTMGEKRNQVSQFNEKLEKEVSAHHHTSKQLVNVQSSRAAQFAKAEKERHAMDAELKSISQELQASKEAYDQTNGKLENEVSAHHHTSEQLINEQCSRTTLQDYFTKAGKERDAMTAELESINCELQASKKAHDLTSKSRKTAEDTVVGCRGYNGSPKRQSYGYKNAVGVKDGQIAGTKYRASLLAHQLSDCKTEHAEHIAALHQRILGYKSALSTKDGQIATLQCQVSFLKGQVASANKKRLDTESHSKANLRDAADEKHAQDRRLQSLQAELDSALSSQQTLRSDVEWLTAAKESAEKQITTTKAELDSALSAQQCLQSDQERLTTWKESGEKQITTMKIELDSALSVQQRLESDEEELTASKESGEKQITTPKADLASAKAAHQFYVESIKFRLQITQANNEIWEDMLFSTMKRDGRKRKAPTDTCDGYKKRKA